MTHLNYGVLLINYIYFLIFNPCFKDVGINEETMKTVAEELQTNVTLTNLSLKQNKIGVEGTKLLCESLKKNATITQLDLFGILNK